MVARVLLMLVALSVVSPCSAAEAEGGNISAGTYRCSSYNVSGAGGSCIKMQPLRLNADGGYQYSSTHGRWSVSDHRLHLSKSGLWGDGEILGSDTVRFEYDYRGLHHVVTWVCRDCAPSKPKGREAKAAGSYVGVTLSLEFDRPVGGVSTFTIVPTEAAANYTHNAPLPEGAVQGLARETGRTTVALATSPNNKLRSGRRYVVFLGWPRETIPVAVLELPAVRTDYTGTLRATLDGDSVLKELAK